MEGSGSSSPCLTPFTNTPGRSRRRTEIRKAPHGRRRVLYLRACCSTSPPCSPMATGCSPPTRDGQKTSAHPHACLPRQRPDVHREGTDSGELGPLSLRADGGGAQGWIALDARAHHPGHRRKCLHRRRCDLESAEGSRHPAYLLSFFIGRLQSGNLLLVKHLWHRRGPIVWRQTQRRELTAFISQDDGRPGPAASSWMNASAVPTPMSSRSPTAPFTSAGTSSVREQEVR